MERWRERENKKNKIKKLHIPFILHLGEEKPCIRSSVFVCACILRKKWTRCRNPDTRTKKKKERESSSLLLIGLRGDRWETKCTL